MFNATDNAGDVIARLEGMTQSELRQWVDAGGFIKYMMTPTMTEIERWMERKAVEARWRRGDIGGALELQAFHESLRST